MPSSPLRAAFLHLRPRSWPIVFAHYATGLAIALYHAPAQSRLAGAIQGILGGLIWTIGMNGGTLALNSAFDRDEGDIGYLDNPPPVPRGLALGSFALMLAGLVGGYFVSHGFLVCYAICLVLSVLYSVPPVRLKSVAGPDVLINMIGYGALTIAAGALSVRSAVTPTGIWLIAASFAFLFGAFYPMTQIYQIPEDTARGDRTLVIVLGERASLVASLFLTLCAAACQLFAARLQEFAVSPVGLLFIAVVFVAWCALILHWLANRAAYPAKRGMYRALWLWGVTNIVTLAVFTIAARPALGQ
ncbi:MAG: UbiA family prenyltransferase [Candidatus Sumerlaeaceae bacterium]|nr:UbiA family prenyltransferase [Candidatus Sumerlaeaceae bacterium]